jgi:hypothetical protein
MQLDYEYLRHRQLALLVRVLSLLSPYALAFQCLHQPRVYLAFARIVLGLRRACPLRKCGGVY